LLAIGFPTAYLASIAADVIGFSLFTLVGGWLLGVGIATLVGAFYRYPTGEPEETAVLDLLTDIYASPVDGDRVKLTGELVGRGTAGYRFSEDLMFQDETGLMYLKYDSWLPLLGDFLFSVREVPDLVGDSVTVEGWYFRATSPWMGLRRLDTGERTLKGFIHLGSFVGAGIALLLGVVVLAVPLIS